MLQCQVDKIHDFCKLSFSSDGHSCKWRFSAQLVCPAITRSCETRSLSLLISFVKQLFLTCTTLKLLVQFCAGVMDIAELCSHTILHAAAYYTMQSESDP